MRLADGYALNMTLDPVAWSTLGHAISLVSICREINGTNRYEEGRSGLGDGLTRLPSLREAPIRFDRPSIISGMVEDLILKGS